MSNKWQDFKYFGWDEDPIGKYKQPEKNPRFSEGQGYPEDDLDREGTMTYGRWMDGKGERKQRMEIRGCKNTERGKKFFVDEEIRPTAPAAPDKGRHR
jgi:hypothetical protein